MTPDGLKLEKNVDRDESIAPTTGRKLDRLTIAVLIAGLGYFIWHSQTAHNDEEIVATAAGQPSIAVLPFENMSSDDEQEYVSDGLTEELLNLLAKIPELKVTSRTSAFFYKGKDVKLPEVGRELGVDHILEGSVRKSGNKIRITAQLIQVASDTHLWSETWDRNLDDVFVIRDEIAAKVVGEWRVQLLGELPHAVATDGETYSLFLRARHTINQRTHESLARGEELIDRAIEIDPGSTATGRSLTRRCRRCRPSRRTVLTGRWSKRWVFASTDKKVLFFSRVSVTVRPVLAHFGLRHSLRLRNSASPESLLNSSLDRTAGHRVIPVGSSDQATRRQSNVI